VLSLTPPARIFLCTAATDMRKGFDGLSGIVRNEMRTDPMSGDVFVFVNRQRTHLKLLFFDGDGFVLFYKRLELGTFAVPAAASEVVAMRRADLMLMLEGIDRASTRQRRRYARAEIAPVEK
jgi:transposase